MPSPPQRGSRREDGIALGVLVWRFGPGWRAISSAPVGGGLGPCPWVLNAQVASGYARTDLAAHAEELRVAMGLAPAAGGATLLTAADVEAVAGSADGDVRADATVGLHVPTWAAADAGSADPTWRPGTINVVVQLPVALTDAALVNAVATATEAKSQALWEAGVPGTGTASDAVVVACAPAVDGQPPEPFAGPRSAWGSRVARAVHRAVLEGVPGSARRILAAEEPGA